MGRTLTKVKKYERIKVEYGSIEIFVSWNGKGGSNCGLMIEAPEVVKIHRKIKALNKKEESE